MTILTCIKNGYNCKRSKTYRTLEKENEILKRQLNQANKQLAVLQNHSIMFKDLPTMEELLNTNQATMVSTAELQAKFKAQFGLKLKMSDSRPSEWGKTSVRWVNEGYANVRIPWWVVKEILDRSPINYYKYKQGQYVCNDFAKSLNCVINLGPYWQAIWGIVRIKNHRVNLVWLSDYEDMIYVEPQTDKVWLPDMNNEKDIPRELIL